MPTTRYALSESVNIAYQVVGDGPRDLVHVPGWISNVAGIAVHIGARISALASEGEILVSRTVKDLVVGSGLEFTDRGLHPLKGVPEDWQLYAVV